MSASAEIAAFLREQISLEEHEARALLSTLMDSTSVSDDLNQQIEAAGQENDTWHQDEVVSQDLLRAKSNQRKADSMRRESAQALDETLTLLERASGIVAEYERAGDVEKLRRFAVRYSDRPGYRKEWAL